jgi:hypothetical protein
MNSEHRKNIPNAQVNQGTRRKALSVLRKREPTEKLFNIVNNAAHLFSRPVILGAKYPGIL